MEVLSICKSLFEDWNSSGIIYCHWKGTANIEKGLIGMSDLDILVRKEDNGLAAKLLEKNGFVQFYTQWGQRYPFIQDWIGCDLLTGKFVHIHYHNRMIAGHLGTMEFLFPWEEAVLDTRVKDKRFGIFIINPEYETLSFFSRIILEFPNKKIKKVGDQYIFSESADNEIAYLTNEISLTEFEVLCKKYFFDDSLIFINFCKQPLLDKSNIFSLQKIIRKYIPHEGNQFLNLTKSLFVRFCLSYYIPYQDFCNKKKVPYTRKGVLIAFMGQDGAGKSTVVKDIKEWLSWKIEVRQYYLGSGDHYRPWEKHLAEKLHGSKNPIAKLIRKWLPFSYLSKLGKHVYKTIIKANKYSQNGGIVLFDRYPQIVFPGINDGPKIRSSIMIYAKGILKPIAEFYARKEEKYLSRAVTYSPDIVIKLMLSPEESIRRKPHENYEMVKQKHEIIKSLRFDCSSVYCVDATQPYDCELLEIKRIIWNSINSK